MLDQRSREYLYFRIPVFIIDLVIHLSVLSVLLCAMEDAYLAGPVSYIGLRIYALLAVSFACSIAVTPIRLHERRMKASVVVWRAMRQTVVTYVLFVALLALVYKTTPRYLVLAQMAVALVAIGLWHYSCNKAVKWLRRMGHNTRHVLIIGGGKATERLYKELSHGQSVTGYKIVGYFAQEEAASLQGMIYLGSPADFHIWATGHHADEVFCTLPPDSNADEVGRIIKVCNDNFIEFSFVPDMAGYPRRNMSISKLGKVYLLRLREEPMNTLKCKLMKRTVDIVVSATFLCTIYPFVCLFVWLGDMLSGNRGPLYFRQERTGYNGRNFKIYKFRSMRQNDDADRVQATKDDPRKTGFGNFLRKSSIDELPQFINVLKGDMSIIGPRPHMLYHTEMYSAMISDYMVRHLAKPGITGWAQVNGCRGETKTTEDMERRVEHDIWYIEHWTPLLDIVVFCKTVLQLLPGRDKQAY